MYDFEAISTEYNSWWLKFCEDNMDIFKMCLCHTQHTILDVKFTIHVCDLVLCQELKGAVVE